ncbi:MAG: MbnP family protein [Flavobacteriia bacterium]|jgi:hypothetical protein
MKFLIFTFSFLFTLTIFSQSERTVDVKINIIYGNEKLEAEKWYALNKKDSVLVQNLKFYLTGFKFLRDEHSLYQEKNSFHLLDLLDSNSCHFEIQVPKKMYFNLVQFNLGIDSLTSASGAQGGALDPTKGMYWTWQTGYINFKLEGKSNLCDTRNNAFTFHVGGFSGEQNSLYVITFNNPNQNKIEINLDLHQVFKSIDLQKQNHIMSPSKEAVELAYKFASEFIVR